MLENENKNLKDTEEITYGWDNEEESEELKKIDKDTIHDVRDEIQDNAEKNGKRKLFIITAIIFTYAIWCIYRTITGNGLFNNSFNIMDL